MKKKIGELNGKPIVIGNANEVTINEYYLATERDGVIIKKRASNGQLVSIAPTPAHTHITLQKVNQVNPTTETFGVQAYYQCTYESGESKYFTDENGYNEIKDLNAWKETDGRIDKLPQPVLNEE